MKALTIIASLLLGFGCKSGEETSDPPTETRATATAESNADQTKPGTPSQSDAPKAEEKNPFEPYIDSVALTE